MIVVSIWTRALDGLAKSGHIHGLPAPNGPDALEKLASRALNIHIASNVRVVHGSLLVNANAVVI